MALLVGQPVGGRPIFVFRAEFRCSRRSCSRCSYAGFSVFIFVANLVARQQIADAQDQRRLNAELRATRALLAESARVNERPGSRANCTTCSAAT